MIDSILTLFFIDGPVPSEKDLDEASKLEGRVVFRNAQGVTKDCSIEFCVNVAGAVPDIYKRAVEGFEDAEEDTTQINAAIVKAIIEDDAADAVAPVKAPKGRKPRNWTTNTKKA